MVSLQPSLSPEEKKAASCIPHLEDFLSKKRKLRRDEEDGQGRDWLACRLPKLAKTEEKKKPDIDLHLDAPLPLEWQQCLDIQSGEIHFYNTRTHKRTSKDPRLSPEVAAPPPASQQQPISLDLELNLACEPRRRSTDGEEKGKEHKNVKLPRDPKDELDCTGARSSSPWISLDADRQEMVATVCMRCHMLVMMCKATLSCPNCKFVHPPSHRSPTAAAPTSSTAIKPTLKLLCCKD